MAKKDEKSKVGRPRLADSKTKKESIFVCAFVFAIALIVAALGYGILTINLNPKYNVGTVYNTHVNSCVVENKTIDCGPNVTYMKYKTDDSDYTIVTKENDSIKVKLDGYKTIDFCYKTDKADLRCNK